MKRFLLLLAFLAVAVRPSSAAPKTPLRYSRHIVIAASNTDPQDKKLADFVCTGKNDERVINKAIEKLKYGGTIQLLDGDYNIDAFEQDGNSAIYFGFNDGNARTISLVGTTENKSYNTRFGVTLHVTEKAFSTMNDNEVYRVFYGTAQKPEYEGVFFKYTYINNVNIVNEQAYKLKAAVEHETTAIASIAVDESEVVSRYDMKGNPVDSTYKGIQIIRLKNGKTIKLNVK